MLSKPYSLKNFFEQDKIVKHRREKNALGREQSDKKFPK